MPTLNITKTYADDSILFEADLDAMRSSIETFVNVTKLDSDNIQDGAIGTDQLASAAITSDKIASGAVNTAAIADAAVTTAKISDGAITTAKISDGAVTRAKLVPLGQQISASCGNFSTTSTSFVDITNLSVTLTTTGRPVLVNCLGTDSLNNTIILTSSAAETYGFEVKLVRDSTDVATDQASITSGTSGTALRIPPAGVSFIDPAPAGTYVYKLQTRKINGNGNTLNVQNIRLLAYEAF